MSSKYKTSKQLNLPEIDNEILKYWEDNNIFKKSIDQRDPNNSFVFYEGPPSANGMPGIHHVMARTIKDLFCRYHTMLGKRVERKGGWDTHGLPVELKVETELGITKEDIGTKITIDEYNDKCKETVMQYKSQWDDLTIKMGYWVDLDAPYITFENEYIESVWALLKILYDKNLLYTGYTIQPYSPAAGTGLSTHELNMPGAYREVKDTSIVAQFKVIKCNKSLKLFGSESVEESVYFLAWTTTPWTLPSNCALTVGKNIVYTKILTYNPYTKLPVSVILAKPLVSKWFKKENEVSILPALVDNAKNIPYLIEGEWTGEELEGIYYEQLLPYGPPTDGDAFRVIIGDFVTTEDGTGIVHTAPSFGADDMRVAKLNGIGALTLVDKQGRFTEEVTDFSGRYVKDYANEPNYQSVDIDIAIKLKNENKAFNVQKYEHNYPHCWRTDKPVLYYPLDSWFVRVSQNRDKLVNLNQTINWKPSHTGEKRFGNWLENAQDWNLSRSRYWGTPLPIWRTEDGNTQICIGSIAELQTEIDKANKVLNISQEIPKDLHRPYIDAIILVTDTGEKMTRELDIIDVWFDSGAMPYAQWHYPFENKEKFEKNFPADFISEGVDQTRGWFYTLHTIAGLCFDSIAYRNVVSTGLVLDKTGVKMSKRLGNTIDSFTTLSQYGADATRWYMIANNQPWDNLKFDIEGLNEVRRKFFGTLYNTYSFFALYANVDEFKYEEADLTLDQRPELDRWILSLLETLVKEVTQYYEDYEPTLAARKISTFVEDNLSNWFVRLSRRRFWKGQYTEDKISAYQTLYQCLVTSSKLIAPIAPFFSDWLFINLNSITCKEQNESVHLCLLPISDSTKIDKELEKKMDYAQRISSLVLSLRKKNKIRVRQPLQKIILPWQGHDFESTVRLVQDIILSEVNIKELQFLTESEAIVKKSAKANFKTLGKRLGKQMKQVANHIATLTNDQIVAIEKENKYSFEIENQIIDITPEDLEIISEEIPGLLVANDGELTVALDINITENLKLEGLAREIINKIQNLRKSFDFDVTDRINITISHNDLLKKSIEMFREYISTEVLADSIAIAENEGELIEILEEISCKINLVKV